MKKQKIRYLLLVEMMKDYELIYQNLIERKHTLKDLLIIMMKMF